jgi:energy-coupling factor transport system ATP-binding protein
LQQPERQFFLPTVREEIQFGPSNLGRPIDRGPMEQLLQLVGLEPILFSDRDPLTLSGGEKRRLAFAAVLSMNPSIVIFDEPTCGLDPDGVASFVELVRALKERKKGIVIISHDGWLINHLTDRVLWLDGDKSRLMKTSLFVGEGYSSQLLSPESDFTFLSD